MSRISWICAAVAACLITVISVSQPHAQHRGHGKGMTMKTETHKLGSLTVEAPWARASAGAARAGAAFLKVVNDGAAGDRLVAVAASVAERVELHTHLMQDGVMRMRRVEAVPVPGSGSAELKPGGYHVMLLGLHAPLKEGTTFPLTLTFEKAGTITVPVAVGRVTARGSGMQHHDGK